MNSMKLFLLAGITALTVNTYSSDLVNSLTNILNEELSYSDGKINEMNCQPSRLEGVNCLAELEFIDTVFNGATQGGGSYTCNETYQYSGGETYKTTCSTCWFSKDEDYFSNTCFEAQQNIQKNVRLQKLKESLNDAISIGLIETYSEPLFMGSYEDDAFYTIEVYKLNYTKIAANSEGESALVEMCSYIKYDHSLRQHYFSKVSCDEPWEHVMEDKVFDDGL